MVPMPLAKDGEDGHITVWATLVQRPGSHYHPTDSSLHCSGGKRHRRDQGRKKPCPHRATNKTTKMMVLGAWEETAAGWRAGVSVGVMAIENHRMEVSLKRQPLRKQVENSDPQTLE